MSKQLHSFGATRLGQCRHNRAYAGSGLDEAGRHQMCDHLVRCVGIDLKLPAKRTNGRKWISRVHFSRDHCFLSGIHDLLVERNAKPEIYAEGKHGRVL